MTSDETIVTMRNKLLAWEDANRKDYPWRQTRNPYHILVSEFMLHRTQAKQVEKVYLRFLTRFPTLKDVASSPDDARKILQPLGLQWRIDAMISALTELWSRYHTVPLDVEKLMSVPGIGPYIASATVCFSTNTRLPLVDTNTVRVTGRFLGLSLQGEARRRKEVISAIFQTCDPERPRDYYYAMIDLAHVICKPSQPQCTVCPLADIPCAFALQRTEERKQ